MAPCQSLLKEHRPRNQDSVASFYKSLVTTCNLPTAVCNTKNTNSRPHQPSQALVALPHPLTFLDLDLTCRSRNQTRCFPNCAPKLTRPPSPPQHSVETKFVFKILAVSFLIILCEGVFLSTHTSYVCVTRKSGTPRGQKRALEILELELQTVVRHHVSR